MADAGAGDSPDASSIGCPSSSPGASAAAGPAASWARSRSRPPRRPRRRDGSASAIAFISASNIPADALIAAASGHVSGSSFASRERSDSRSSAVRARRVTRSTMSRYRVRSWPAAAAPSVRATSDASAGASGAAGGRRSAGGCDLGPRGRSRSRSQSRSSTRPAAESRASAAQSNVRSGCVCSSASRTSASSGCRPTLSPAGDLKRYSTRPRCAPLVARYACMTYV